MKINDTSDHIRQNIMGHFRRPEDGEKPYVYSNNKRLISSREQRKAVIYANNETIGKVEKNLKKKTQKIFDFDMGVQYSFDKPKEATEETEAAHRYDKTGNAKLVSKKEYKIDQLV